MPLNLLIPALVILLPLAGCASQQAPVSHSAAPAPAQSPSRYCSVNLYDIRDVPACYDTRDACEKAIAKSPKYVCNTSSSLKYPPKSP